MAILLISALLHITISRFATNNITEILLKVALNTINPTLIHKTNYIPLIFCDEIF
jgi:hypothetical protein